MYLIENIYQTCAFKIHFNQAYGFNFFFLQMFLMNSFQLLVKLSSSSLPFGSHEFGDV